MSATYYSSMRNKLLVTMIIVPAIPFCIVVLIGYYYFTASLQSSTMAKMSRIVDDHRQMIELFLAERKSDLQFITDTYAYSEITIDEILAGVFEHLRKKSTAFFDIGIFDQNGLHVAYTGPFELVGKDYSQAEWFKWVLRKDTYISDVFLGYRNIPHFVIALTKEEPSGEKYVIRATIDSSWFSGVVEQVRIGKTGEAYILDAHGKLQTQRRSGGYLMDRDMDSDELLVKHRGVRTFVSQRREGDRFLYATTWLNHDNWLLVARQETTEAFQHLRKVANQVIIVTALGGILIVSIAFLVTNRTVRRMRRTETEKNELGNQLIVAGRLAEIGEMSAGFAHEINNPLQIIRAEQTLIEAILGDLKKRGDWKESEDSAQVEDSLHQVRVQVDRCAEITQALLKFARQKDSQTQEVDLAPFLKDLMGLVERKVRVEGIVLNQDIPPGVPKVTADPAQLEQVMVNLINNAIDAVVERHGSQGGEITINGEPTRDNRVTIRIRDNGIGIRPENLEKIYTPFFTTKPVGKGTGLGLSICYGIVAKMGGAMEVHSEPGVGTTFTLHLKRA